MKSGRRPRHRPGRVRRDLRLSGGAGPGVPEIGKSRTASTGGRRAGRRMPRCRPASTIANITTGDKYHNRGHLCAILLEWCMLGNLLRFIYPWDGQLGWGVLCGAVSNSTPTPRKRCASFCLMPPVQVRVLHWASYMALHKRNRSSATDCIFLVRSAV
jgi:hypothetical protein